MISRSDEVGLVEEPSYDVPHSCKGTLFFYLLFLKINSVQEASLCPNQKLRGFRRFKLFEHILAPDLIYALMDTETNAKQCLSQLKANLRQRYILSVFFAVLRLLF